MQAIKNPKTKRFSLRFYDSEGIQQCFTSKRHFPEGATQREANRIATIIYNAHEDALARQTRPSLSDCVDRMIQHLKDEGKSGISGYQNHANMAMKYDNDSTIDDIADVCNQMIRSMRQNGKPTGVNKGQPYSDSTIRHRAQIFQRTANLAYAKWKILERPLAEFMDVPAASLSRDRFLSHDEACALMKAVENDEIRNILLLKLLTGIRQAELMRMGDGDVFGSRLTVRAKNAKTRKARAFKLSKHALDAAASLSFPLTIKYDTLNDAFNDAKDIAGIENFRMHDLRHTFASWLAQSGKVSIHQLQQVMGHANIQQTTKYAHLMPQHLDNVASILSLTHDGEIEIGSMSL